MQSITGARQTDLDPDTPGIPTVDGDTFIIRKQQVTEVLKPTLQVMIHNLQADS